MDWVVAYRESHTDLVRGKELPLTEHVVEALKSRGVEADRARCASAVACAFAPEVDTRPGAVAAIEAAAQHGPVGICSNCSVRGLVSRALSRSAIAFDFDAVVTSVGCGWRKPDARAFEAVATRLGVDVESVVHVGDDTATDGGVEAVGGTFIDVSASPLSALCERLAALEGAKA